MYRAEQKTKTWEQMSPETPNSQSGVLPSPSLLSNLNTIGEGASVGKGAHCTLDFIPTFF